MKKSRNINKFESGQALVLVLLSLAVVLTLVLYILSRSVTDILVSSKSEETSRAFSAAEAGVEQALVIGAGGSNANIGNNSGFVSSVGDVAKNSNTFNYPIDLGSGDSFTTWFVAHDTLSGLTVCNAGNLCFTGNTLQICWGKPGTASNLATTPAIEASVYYETSPGVLSTIAIGRVAVDPNSGRTTSNMFSAPDAGACTIGGENYAFQKTIQFSSLGIPAGSYGVENGLQFARIRMLYNSDAPHPIAVSTNFAGDATLPSQGQSIISTGTAGKSTRRISVFQGWPEFPDVFEGAIYSPSGLTK